MTYFVYPQDLFAAGWAPGIHPAPGRSLLTAIHGRAPGWVVVTPEGTWAVTTRPEARRLWKAHGGRTNRTRPPGP